MRCKFKLFAAIFFALIPTSVSAGAADVTTANVTCQSDSTCQFTVTLRHADKGWDHYADRWEVLSLDREVLGTRILYHPHVNEQPFRRHQTRSASAPETQSTGMVVRRSS